MQSFFTIIRGLSKTIFGKVSGLFGKLDVFFIMDKVSSSILVFDFAFDFIRIMII